MDYDVDKDLVERVWEDEKKGLRKELINFKFVSIVKASELSNVNVDFFDIQNLNNHKSNYLKEESNVWIEIGHSVTAIDCYVEEFLKQMLINETSKCSIKSKCTGEINFTVRMKKIEFGGYYHEQSPTQMFQLARLYKENGVKMFKEFPLFAHNYFNLSAKCLLSFQTQDVDYDELLKESSVTKKDFDELLQNVYLNIAACLIKQERFEDILSILEFVKLQDNPPEKGGKLINDSHSTNL
jgi:hypothetical protein